MHEILMTDVSNIVENVKNKILIGVFLLLSAWLFASINYGFHLPGFLSLNIVSIISRILALMALILGWYGYRKKGKYALIILIPTSLLYVYYVYLGWPYTF